MLASSSPRRSARFVVLFDSVAPSPTRDSSRPTGRLVWRVVAANNRPLGRSTATYSDFEACLAAALDVHRRSREAHTTVTFDHSSVSWTWTVSLDAEPVATSVRSYSRRIECSRALTQFTEVVRTTSPAIDDVRYVGAGSARR